MKRERVSVPDRLPRESLGQRFTNVVARNLPFGNDRVYVSLWLEDIPVGGGAHRIVPWLFLYNDETGHAWRLLRLPGAKLVELWNPQAEKWLERFVGAPDVDEDDE